MAERFIDLAKGYLPIILVVVMLASCSLAAWKLSKMASSVSQNTVEIQNVGKSLEVLPSMTIDIALIKYELGIESNKGPTAFSPYLK